MNPISLLSPIDPLERVNHTIFSADEIEKRDCVGLLPTYDRPLIEAMKPFNTWQERKAFLDKMNINQIPSVEYEKRITKARYCTKKYYTKKKVKPLWRSRFAPCWWKSIIYFLLTSVFVKRTVSYSQLYPLYRSLPTSFTLRVTSLIKKILSSFSS